MRGRLFVFGRSAALLAVLAAWVMPAAANPSVTADFNSMTQWLSHELAQEIAFNAGSTFDPPHEVVSRNIQPDLSLGLGHMPFDKSTFPALQTQKLNDMPVANVFPSSVLFPNLVTHLRAGLPGRMDLSVRFADMTTPNNYKLSNTATGKGQSNSIGFSLRKHFFGEDGRPLLSLGANYNHVYGNFDLRSNFDLSDQGAGFTAQSPIDAKLVWNVSSFGLNAIVSRPWRGWTPFAGVGYNYATGSIRTRLEAQPNTTLVSPIIGESSDHPEQNQARIILGFEVDRPWMHFFANGEVKAMGEHALGSWIIAAGAALPFEIGRHGISMVHRPPADPASQSPQRAPSPRPEAGREIIFIQ